MKIEIEVSEEDFRDAATTSAHQAVQTVTKSWQYPSFLQSEARKAMEEISTKIIQEIVGDDEALQRMITKAVEEAIFRKVTVHVRKMELTPAIVAAVLKLEASK